MKVPPIETETWMEMDAVFGQMFYAYNDYHLTPRNNDDFINISVKLEKTNLPVSPLTAISELHQNDFTIYPNPASDVMNIIYGTDFIHLYEVYDIQGRQLHKQQVNSKHIQLDVTPLRSGLYVIVIHTERKKAFSARINVKH